MAKSCPCGCGRSVPLRLRGAARVADDLRAMQMMLATEVVGFWARIEESADEDDVVEHAAEQQRLVIDFITEGRDLSDDYVTALHGDTRMDLRPGQVRAWMKAGRGIWHENSKLAQQFVADAPDA